MLSDLRHVLQNSPQPSVQSCRSNCILVEEGEVLQDLLTCQVGPCLLGSAGEMRASLSLKDLFIDA